MRKNVVVPAKAGTQSRLWRDEIIHFTSSWIPASDGMMVNFGLRYSLRRGRGILGFRMETT